MREREREGYTKAKLFHVDISLKPEAIKFRVRLRLIYKIDERLSLDEKMDWNPSENW